MAHIRTDRGTSLVDVLVGVAIMMIVFMALYAAFTAAVEFGTRNRFRTNALLVANEQLEIIRALPYDSVGTVSGLPPGTIPQVETVTKNGQTFTRRTFIQYVDDPADGLDTADTLTADYKRVKVEVSYSYHGIVQSFSLVTTVAPRTQEALAGAGILRINVTDATNAPLSGVAVHVLNNTVATSVDITTYTNTTGSVSFPGAWAGTGYQISATKPGYSLAQTYNASSTNPNPSPSAATVAEGLTTELYLKIDRLSTLRLLTGSWPVHNTFSDSYADSSHIVSSTSVQVSGGSLLLAGAPGSYAANGTATTSDIASGSLGTWLAIRSSSSKPVGTNVRTQVYYDVGGGIYDLVPDTDLPGNAAGLTATMVDISGLSPATYGTLRVTSELTTSDVNVTPSLDSLIVSYEETVVPVGNVSCTLRGSKTIGTDAGGNPIYKYVNALQTDTSGSWQSTTMEWDTYELSVSGYTVVSACPTLPIVLQPDTMQTHVLTVGSASANSLSVTVTNGASAAVPRAEVTISAGASSATRATDDCGIAYFPVATASTYTVLVHAPGYMTYTTSIAVSGAATLTATLLP